MKNHPSSSIKNTSLFKMYDLQNNYQKHKQKISHIKNKNAKETVKKQYSSQLSAVNELKKNWIQTQATRNIFKGKQIYDSNQLLYNQIIKVRNRVDSRPKMMSENNILTRSHVRTSHSVNQENSLKIIQTENEKLMERLLSVKSPLSKGNMRDSYRKIKETKQRLESYSSVNKSRIKSTLTKFNLKPKIYFPTIESQTKILEGSKVKETRKSHSTQRLQGLENQFLNLNTVSKKSSTAVPWQSSSFVSKNKSIQMKQNLRRNKLDFSIRSDLNRKKT